MRRLEYSGQGVPSHGAPVTCVLPLGKAVYSGDELGRVVSHVRCFSRLFQSSWYCDGPLICLFSMSGMEIDETDCEGQPREVLDRSVECVVLWIPKNFGGRKACYTLEMPRLRKLHLTLTRNAWGNIQIEGKGYFGAMVSINGRVAITS